jgi:hypothetical protein
VRNKSENALKLKGQDNKHLIKIQLILAVEERELIVDLNNKILRLKKIIKWQANPQKVEAQKANHNIITIVALRHKQNITPLCIAKMTK